MERTAADRGHWSYIPAVISLQDSVVSMHLQIVLKKVLLVYGINGIKLHNQVPWKASDKFSKYAFFFFLQHPQNINGQIKVHVTYFFFISILQIRDFQDFFLLSKKPHKSNTK